MHPILASLQRLALYVASWLQIAVLLAFAYSAASAAGTLEALLTVVPLCIVYAFVCLSAWYVCRAVPLQGGGMTRIFAAHLVSGGIAAALWILLWETWTPLLAAYPSFNDTVAHYRSQLPLILASGVLLFWLAGMFHYLLIAFESSRHAETRELGLEVFARDAELKALRAQINPHFLFNSLNSISALTTSDPAGARRMCLLLADFFRSSVRLGARDRISLVEEITMVRQYLEIEQVRFGPRLVADIGVDARCESCPVPPLILQPLVENSVRHGINSLVEGGVLKIAARCTPGYLNLSVDNPVDAETPVNTGTGIGLANVKLRLKTLFGSESETHVTQAAQRFRVEIRLPCRPSTESTEA